MKVSIKHYKTISQTPALPILLEGWYELAKSKLCANEIMVAWDHEALVAFADDDRYSEAPVGKPIGVLSFTHSQYNYSFYVCIGYVLPKLRRAGVYNQLWKGLVSKAQEEKVVVINSSTNINNERMLNVAENQGRNITGYSLVYNVPELK
jgi:hypothetical protein